MGRRFRFFAGGAGGGRCEGGFFHGLIVGGLLRATLRRGQRLLCAGSLGRKFASRGGKQQGVHGLGVVRERTGRWVKARAGLFLLRLRYLSMRQGRARFTGFGARRVCQADFARHLLCQVAGLWQKRTCRVFGSSIRLCGIAWRIMCVGRRGGKRGPRVQLRG
ncbi:hypothetical protein D3C71_811120 [compost metagenome]